KKHALAEVRRHDATEFILAMARKHGSKLTIVSTAPLTNLALAFRKNAAVMRKVRNLEIMGGAFEKRDKAIGNITDYSEFNIFCDPEASRTVFNSGIPITLYPLDVTEKVRLVYSTLTCDLGVSSTELTLIKSMSKTYMNFHSRVYGFRGC